MLVCGIAALVPCLSIDVVYMCDRSVRINMICLATDLSAALPGAERPASLLSTLFTGWTVLAALFPYSSTLRERRPGRLFVTQP